MVLNFFLSDPFRLAGYSQGPSLLSQMAVFRLSMADDLIFEW